MTVTGTIKRSRVHGTLGAGGAPLGVRTGDGSIRLIAAANPRRPYPLAGTRP